MSYTLTANWLPADKYALKAPYPMTPEGLIVHNTAGSASAMEEAQAMCTNDSAVSFHVVIDEENAVECIPFSRNAFHAGDGSAGYANRHLIGLEIARSMDAESDRFDRAEENAAEYIAHVCLQYGWTSTAGPAPSCTSTTGTPPPNARIAPKRIGQIFSPRSTPTSPSSAPRQAPIPPPRQRLRKLPSASITKIQKSAAKTKTAPSTSPPAICSKPWATASAGKTGKLSRSAND